jgi:HAD superfamily hydrolase (TIGR01549 family)
MPRQKETEKNGMQQAPFPLNLTGIRACLFDFGGTLDADGVTWQDRFYPLYLRHGVQVNRDTFREAFFYADDTLIAQRALLGAGLYETLDSQVALVLQYLGKNGTETRAAIVRSFLEEMTATIERNRALLERLSRRFMLGIVSNFYGNLVKVCEDLALSPFFHVIVDSTLVGALKPDPQIFRTALERLSISPHECVFVGDNKARDMAGAKAIGMPHVWLAQPPQARLLEPCCTNDLVISSLLELEPLLLGSSATDGHRPGAGDRV